MWSCDAEVSFVICNASVQGMSDLAVPMLLIFEDDVMAFWCFERLMQRVRKNFRHDESGIK